MKTTKEPQWLYRTTLLRSLGKSLEEISVAIGVPLYSIRYWLDPVHRLKTMTSSRRFLKKVMDTPVLRMKRRLDHSRRHATANGYEPCCATVQELLDSWTGYCEICGAVEVEGDHKTSLQMDHCHTTGVFRGWLCGSCNKMVGLLGNDPNQRLIQVADYLMQQRNNP